MKRALAVAALLGAAALALSSHDAEARKPRHARDGGVTVPPPASPGPLGSPRDFCEEFNRREAESAARDTSGCPHCPCHCSDGKIACAPCAACRPSNRRAPVVAPDVSTVSGVPRRDGGADAR